MIGEILPAEAWQLHEAGKARIVDVRTLPEWRDIGRPPGVDRVEWTGDPIAFAAAIAARYRPEETLLFLCRSAVRSHHAAHAAAGAGYPHAYNILEGFEGPPDGSGVRSRISGWLKAGLPAERG